MNEENYLNLRTFAFCLTFTFNFSYACDSTFSTMTVIRSIYSAYLTDYRFDSRPRLGVSNYVRKFTISVDSKHRGFHVINYTCVSPSFAFVLEKNHSKYICILEYSRL
jgi:hypothetical protein